MFSLINAFNFFICTITYIITYTVTYFITCTITYTITGTTACTIIFIYFAIKNIYNILAYIEVISYTNMLLPITLPVLG